MKSRTKKISAIAALCVFVIVAALLAFVGLGGSGWLRGPLLRYVASRSGRDIQVRGVFEAHILSMHPRLVAEDVSIGNPPWTPRGTMAQIGRLELVFDAPTISHGLQIRSLAMDGAKFYLQRDVQGLANWQWTDPRTQIGHGPPIIHGLSMPQAHIELDDARRHLRFSGAVTARELPDAVEARGPPNARDAPGALNAHEPPDAPRTPNARDAQQAPGTRPLRLRFEAEGQLNGHAVSLTLDGDPLATASHAVPYHFAFEERSSGTRLTGHGVLPEPFDFGVSDTGFDAAGADLKDLYFLTGVGLPDTGVYRLAGKLARRGPLTSFTDLLATTGRSDMHGNLSIRAIQGRPLIEGELESQWLRLRDLGAHAAGRVPTGSGAAASADTPLLFPDHPLPLDGMRRVDARVNFRARTLEVGRELLGEASARIEIEHGVVTVAPMAASYAGGKISGRAGLDIGRDAARGAGRDSAAGNLDLRLTGLQLGQFHRKSSGPPSLEGPVHAHLLLTGRGRSPHEFASNASGTITAIIPHGSIRTSLAELAGVDLRGLGLLMEKNRQESAIRCGVASFEARAGTVDVRTLVFDTDPVLITGDGSIDLESEALDLTLRGRPKSLRLMRVRAPVTVTGTLSHPLVGIKASGSALQVGAAAALGVALTPLAAVLAFVDPGLAKDADCAALLARYGRSPRAQ